MKTSHILSFEVAGISAVGESGDDDYDAEGDDNVPGNEADDDGDGDDDGDDDGGVVLCLFLLLSA